MSIKTPELHLHIWDKLVVWPQKSFEDSEALVFPPVKRGSCIQQCLGSFLDPHLGVCSWWRPSTAKERCCSSENAAQRPHLAAVKLGKSRVLKHDKNQWILSELKAPLDFRLDCCLQAQMKKTGLSFMVWAPAPIPLALLCHLGVTLLNYNDDDITSTTKYTYWTPSVCWSPF